MKRETAEWLIDVCFTMATILFILSALSAVLAVSSRAEAVEPEPVIVETVPEKEARITFYCNCPACCGKWYTPEALGKAGVPLVEGLHCAATKDIPLGATVEIEGYGKLIVADRVADWVYEKHGTTIDVFMGSNHDGAVRNGVRKCEVIIGCLDSET
jgi:3D (Asp-Asp-Asp) domain-containing protein